MPGGLIASVADGSLAARAGLRSGDELIAINGHTLRDVLDVQVYSAEERLVFEAQWAGEQRTCARGGAMGSHWASNSLLQRSMGFAAATTIVSSASSRRCSAGCGLRCTCATMTTAIRSSLAATSR